jgi:hypothetical protein
MQMPHPAARARIWRASRRTTATFGWLALVIQLALIGGLVCRRTVAQEQPS